MGLYQRFLQNNPDFSLRDYDARNDRFRQELDISDTDREELTAQLRARKRLLSLDIGEDWHDAFLRKDIHSALHISRMSEKTFLRSMDGAGIPDGTLRGVYQQARRVHLRMMHLLADIKTAANSPAFRTNKGNTLGTDMEAFLHSLPDYQDLFGQVDYCDCDECMSIFGPAAYFVDLMRIIHQYITEENDIPEALTLRVRRPDLWLLPLTCENTNKLVPYLQIVNERLSEAAKPILSSQDPYRAMATLCYPMSQPVIIPLETIRIAFSTLGFRLADFWEVWQCGSEAVKKEQANLSQDDFLMLTAEAATSQQIAKYYGQSGDPLVLKDALLFAQAAQLDPSGLSQLLDQGLSESDLVNNKAQALYINAGLADSQVLHIKDGVIENLNVEALDRLNRVLRFSHKLGIPYAQLDWLIGTLSGTGVSLSQQMVLSAPLLLHWARTTGLSLIETSVLMGPMKTYGTEFDGQCFFDAVFNGANRYQDSRYRPDLFPQTVLHFTDQADIADYLSACLKLSVNDVFALKHMLSGSAEAVLDISVLSDFYRHALLLRLLGMDVDTFAILRKMTGWAGRRIYTADELCTLFSMSALFQKTGVSFQLLDYWANGVFYDCVEELFTQDSLLSFLASVRNKHYPPTEAVVGVTLALSLFLNATYEETESVTTIALKGLGLTRDDWAALFTEENPTPHMKTIETFMRRVSGWLIFARRLRLDGSALESMSKHPAVYGLPEEEFAHSLDNARSLCLWSSYLQIFDGDTQLLTHFAEETAAQQKLAVHSLAEATGWSGDSIQTVIDILGENLEVISFLATADACITVMKKLGADRPMIQSLRAMANPKGADYQTIHTTAQNFINLLQGVYGDAWESGRQQIQKTVHLRKRDALTDIVLRGMAPQGIATRNELYSYFLIDVEMGQTTEISYVKEGLNALQLYLQRCRLHLEPVRTMGIHDSWWLWMMSYREWEANRKIFVYPENYLIPSLRTSKTELFDELESAVTRGNFTTAYADELYRTYLDGLSDISNIEPIEQCLTGDGCYLFAKSNRQPADFYVSVRQKEGGFGAWTKIDVQINAQYITPLYIFDRIYIFWSEMHILSENSVSGSGGTINTTSSNVHLGTIHYTFLNNQNKWQPSQILVEDDVLFHEGADPDILANPIFADVFDMKDIAWNKPMALAVEKDGKEQLLIYLGKFANQQNEVITPVYSTLKNYKGDFLRRLFTIIDTSNRMLGLWKNGHHCAGTVRCYTSDLRETERNSVFLFDPYEKNVTGLLPLRPVITVQKGEVGLLYHKNTIQNTHTGQNATLSDLRPKKLDRRSFLSPSISSILSDSIFIVLSGDNYKLIDKDSGMVNTAKWLSFDLRDFIKGAMQSSEFIIDIEKIFFNSMGGTILLGATGEDALLTPVSGTPGSFLLRCGGETFLLAPKQKSPSRYILDTQWLDVCALRGLGYDMEKSEDFIALLQENKVIDQRGIVLPPYKNNREKLNNLLSVDYPDVRNYLLGYPLPLPQFLAPYSDDTGELVLLQLYTAGMIDRKRQVDLYKLAETPASSITTNIFSEILQMPPDEAAFVYEKALHVPSWKYVFRSHETLLPPLDAPYTATRLSNASIRNLRAAMYKGGVEGLLTIRSQETPVIPVLPFDRLQPASQITGPGLSDGAQPDFGSLYGEFNWEVFYHIPMLIAQTLKNNFRNREAHKWYEFIFKPSAEDILVMPQTFSDTLQDILTPEQSQKIHQSLLDHSVLDDTNHVAVSFDATTDLSFLTEGELLTKGEIVYVRNILLNCKLAAPLAYYWNFKPFREHTVDNILQNLSDEAAIYAYNETPFDPHAIARLRICAYEKNTVMEYIDNLIQWGDKEFTLFTWESINTATMLYVSAYDLLGSKPQKHPKKESIPKTYQYFHDKYQGKVPQFLLELETCINGYDGDWTLGGEVKTEDVAIYFEVPDNDKLLGYWDIIEDRLHKIRHSMDIDGKRRTPALFEPPLNIADYLRPSLQANCVSELPLSNRSEIAGYRFSFLLERAKYYASVLTQFSSTAQAALEKGDSEDFMVFINSHEKTILDMTLQIKEEQEQESELQVKAIEAGIKGAKQRLEYYQTLLQTGISDTEAHSMSQARQAAIFTVAAQGVKAAASVGYAIPQLGSPLAITYGGQQLGSMLNAAGGVLDTLSSLYSYYASESSVMAGYQRRAAEWELQKNLSVYEMENLSYQKIVAETRRVIAQADTRIQRKMISQKQEVYDFLKNKFGSAQLYNWMIGKLGGFVWQAYQMALEAARAAEAAYGFELDSDDTFIHCVYWDNQKRGLLAGEALTLSLNDMELAYYRNNKRRFEIEKNISLAVFFPEALAQLKRSGECTFHLTQGMFDADYPGQYARKIKTVSLSIPALIPPYETIKAVLTQTSYTIASKPDKTAALFLLRNCTGDRGSGLITQSSSEQKIAVSRGIEDNGLFMLDFNDGRYLPFEGTGAVSSWSLEMPIQSNHFDFDSISDVIINLKYTSLENSELREALLSNNI